MTDPDYSADVVIVGSGVAGALAAAELAERGADVLVVEAGPRITRNDALLTYYDHPSRNWPSAPYPDVPYAQRPSYRDPDTYVIQGGPDRFQGSYERLVGGTTWHWEATSLRFLPADFRIRSEFGIGVDWPLTYEDLEPWYGAAERAMGIAGDPSDDLGSPRSEPYPMPPMPHSYMDRQFRQALAGSPYTPVTTPAARNTEPYAGRLACCGSNSCTPICPSGAKYDALSHVEAAERAGARVIHDTVVYHISLNDSRQIAGLGFKRPDGSEGAIDGQVFVLAAHALETPKLLLMSRGEDNPQGVANSSGLVGRNLMDHPYKASWALANRPVWPMRGPITITSIENTRWGDWRTERPAYRIAIYNLGWGWATGAPVTTITDFIDQGLEGEQLVQAIRDDTSRQVMIASMTEQLPDPENRIVPDFDQRDAIGIPRPKTFYRFDDYTHRGMAASEAAHEEVFGLLGTDQPRHSPDPLAGSHIMGTCVMGVDPAASVVDSDLRSHDHPNLFVLGSSVFATSAAANPTLTIAALSLRAVQPILDQFSQ
ncbi:MAG: GMC family oxidoreductase [Pseudomonadota bacterium]